MSTLDVVAEVLREVAPRALKARQIAELAGSRLPTASRTPETVVSRDLALDVKSRGAASRFLRVDRGAFVLKEALPTAFYNDNDKFAAAWTRNLVAAGEIAPGVVDERSIRDLKPADVAGYRQCHFFSGIGIWSRALRDAGWPDDFNAWSGSCPCVPFSSAGRKRGFSDEQHLWPDWFRLIAACRPTAIFGEQVSSKDGLKWLDLVRVDLEKANYALRVLDIPAACCGAPHRRQRFYFVAYARERGREILSAPWLHDRWKPGNDASRCRAVDGRDAIASDGTLRLGNSCLARSGWNAGEISRAQEDREGERIEAGNLADKSVAPGTVDGGSFDETLVRRAAAATGNGSGFKPGDRIRIDGDPGWGGAVGSFWAEDVEWIYCRPEPGHQNGRWRPVKSGTQPLVDGTSADLGRTRAARLRGFGNGIVRPLAVAFAASVIDAFADAARALGIISVRDEKAFVEEENAA